MNLKRQIFNNKNLLYMIIYYLLDQSPHLEPWSVRRRGYRPDRLLMDQVGHWLIDGLLWISHWPHSYGPGWAVLGRPKHSVIFLRIRYYSLISKLIDWLNGLSVLQSVAVTRLTWWREPQPPAGRPTTAPPAAALCPTAIGTTQPGHTKPNTLLPLVFIITWYRVFKKDCK